MAKPGISLAARRIPARLAAAHAPDQLLRDPPCAQACPLVLPRVVWGRSRLLLRSLARDLAFGPRDFGLDRDRAEFRHRHAGAAHRWVDEVPALPVPVL